MIKKIFALFICIVFCLSLTACKGDLPTIETPSEPSSQASSTPVSSEEEEPEYSPDLDSWQLTLVNGWHPLEEGFMPDLTQIDTRFANEGYKFDSRAIEDLNAMCQAALKDGVKLWVISPWRRNSTQTANFNAQVQRVLKNNPSLTKEQAEDEAATVVARPWTSEHQLGLAVDFNSVEESFEDTPQFEWLSKNAEDYGFIMRYPKSKQAITGVIYEPWHYRYVGVENAKAIKESGLCLEEFLENYK